MALQRAAPRSCGTVRARSIAKRLRASLSHEQERQGLAGQYDVVVIGGGHSGIEAACAAGRMGARTLLLTIDKEKIGTQPCNPAVGGPAKSQLVHEVDALGGEIGRIADETYLQKRTLNSSKGPAVWALRAQTDKAEYARAAKRHVEEQKNVEIGEGHATEFIIDWNDDVRGVRTDGGSEYRASAVVLTAGTFLNGRIWIGRESQEAGRAGEKPSKGLTEHLVRLGFETDRLKTGTPPRVKRSSIDFERTHEQPGEEPLRFFSFDSDCHVIKSQMSCHLTLTNERTHSLIREHLQETPTYGGWADSNGPRYCPSIEDKVVRFADKDSHQIFLEPEGAQTEEMYIQGLSTGLPRELQPDLLRTIPGLEQAEMMRPAYAVEYDYLPATQCRHSLHSKRLENLFLCGQVNGTTGYEEAAAQGIVGGMNAARHAANLSHVELSRESSYIGTLIDDLVTKDLREPYRMLTSRSEHRLLLRADNADARLSGLAADVGLLSSRREKEFRERQDRIQSEVDRLKAHRLTRAKSPLVRDVAERSGQGVPDAMTLSDALLRPKISYSALEDHGLGDPTGSLRQDEKEAVEIRVKYSGFIERQRQQTEEVSRKNNRAIPEGIDYHAMTTLSMEARQKLDKIRPSTIGQASRIGGVTPADVANLLVAIESERRVKRKERKERKKLSRAQRRRAATTHAQQRVSSVAEAASSSSSYE